MPLVVCDKDPCTHLQNAMSKLIVVPEGSKELQLIVKSKEQPHKDYLVPLKYCPFCGTRVDELWVEAFQPLVKRRIM